MKDQKKIKRKTNKFHFLWFLLSSKLFFNYQIFLKNRADLIKCSLLNGCSPVATSKKKGNGESRVIRGADKIGEKDSGESRVIRAPGKIGRSDERKKARVNG